MDALATVRNSGVNSSTAMRVAGNEPLKMITPISPFSHPAWEGFDFRGWVFEVTSMGVVLVRARREAAVGAVGLRWICDGFATGSRLAAEAA
jgi:hypothetical protein